MNILIITQLYPQPDDYGDNKPTKTVEYFAKEWVKAGHNVVVAHCSSRFPLPFYCIPPSVKNKLAGRTSNIFPPMSSRKKLAREEYGIQIYRFPMLKMLPGKGYSQSCMQKQSDEICACLEKIHFVPDLVVGHFANPSTELVANLAQRYKAKSSIVFHGDCNEQTLEKYRLREASSKISAIGARSVLEAQRIKQLLQLQKEPFVCCSGVPNTAIATASVKCEKHDFSNGVRFLYVGSFIKRKHVECVIQAFDAVAKEKDSLVIVGGGPEVDALKALADKMPHAKQIQFTGKVSREAVLQYMRDANIFTLVSEGEVYGMVYIESMLQGCITIASQGGGFDGIIKDGENGFISKAGDTAMLIKTYERIRERDMRALNAIGQNAIDTAIHFSEREVAQNYLEDILRAQE